MCSTSSRVPWKALLAVTAPSTSQMGCRPRSRAASADSTTKAAAPIPTIMPWRRRSNGVAASSTTSSVAAAPEARNPEASQGSSASEVASSAETTTTRRQRPARIQSSASAIAWVVLAQAALTCVFGPRAPMISANWEWPIDRQRNRNRRSNRYGSDVDDPPQIADAPVHLGGGRLVAAHASPHRLQRGQLLAPAAVGEVALHVLRECSRTRETRRRR